jgi:CDP-diacylglycerol--serine O-phosphatidyltransferase
MLLAVEGRYEAAVYVLFAAIMLDSFDGRLARKLGATSTFGQQLDSFSDSISFGVAPAFLLHVAILGDYGLVGFLAPLIYLLAGVYRLARFNILSDAHGKAHRTLGLPIPIACGFLMALVVMRDEMAPGWSVVVVIAVALGMISKARLPDLKGRGLVSSMLLVGLCNFIAVLIWPGWGTVSWWMAWNLLILLATKLEDRRLAPNTAET